MKIAPCPNPKCVHAQPDNVMVCPANFDQSGCYAYCPACGLSGPMCDTDAAAVAAWNSISMGWINSKDRDPPKDGRRITAVISDHGGHDPFICVVHFVNNATYRGWCDGCYCLSRPDTEGFCCGHSLFHDDFVLFWMPIPPTPVDK